MIFDIDLCPICYCDKSRHIYSKTEHIQKCLNCGIVFNKAYRSSEYEKSYFLDAYKKQYGKTYLEDFDNIYRLSLKRIERIKRYYKNDISNARLLDLGSAMGFFLKAAKDSSFNIVQGIEISKFAADHCINEYNISVVNSSFEDLDIEDTYDIITAWYFIEHCPEPAKTVKKIYNALKPKGIFAFSVPSIFGPQYILNKHKWIKNHPNDHRVDFSPTSVKHLLNDLGFKKIFIKPGAIHPERILSTNNLFYRPFSLIYSGFSFLTSFSDTLEIYALK